MVKRTDEGGQPGGLLHEELGQNSSMTDKCRETAD